jgi:TRAP-type mannitol/chloroaromatic compound transport system permease small subunit
MLNKLLHIIDLLNEWSGKIFSWAVIPMFLLVTAEVILRYVFDKPTIWIWDVVVQLMGIIVVFSGGYSLLKNVHVGIDFLVEQFPKKTRAFIDLFTYPFFLFSMGILFWITAQSAWTAVETKEAFNSFWRPPVYQLKVAISVGVFIFLLQGIARFVRSLLLVFPRKVGGES